ncbi:MAG TPA: hypothetical protein VE988_14380, partial [Gemmataceae bacterium]|nr:hypothetical protein [Gemmataceae bacterium]
MQMLVTDEQIRYLESIGLRFEAANHNGRNPQKTFVALAWHTLATLATRLLSFGQSAFQGSRIGIRFWAFFGAHKRQTLWKTLCAVILVLVVSCIATQQEGVFGAFLKCVGGIWLIGGILRVVRSMRD